MIEWNIQSRGDACRMCGQPFLDRQAYHTMLFDEGAGYARHDLCADCWTAQSGETGPDRRDYVSHWQGVFVIPPPRPEPIRRETAESLLRKLLESNDPTHGPACFILAVMLERKRVFKVREEIHQNGRRVFIYEQPATGDVFTITDPALQLGQLDDVQRDVARLLEAGTPSANAQPEPASGDRESGLPDNEAIAPAAHPTDGA